LRSGKREVGIGWCDAEQAARGCRSDPYAGQLHVEIIQFVSACSGEGILPLRAMKRWLEFLLTGMIGA
jgi:hypothetical protein